jgi:hypothetical protein
MLPREHGAYGQLLFPLVTMLAIGRPGSVAIALASSAVCVFLAHEPLLVLLGARGSRAAREDRAMARRWAAALGAMAVGLGTFAASRATGPVRLGLLVPATLAIVLIAALFAGRERTIAGEMLTALTLVSVSLPVGLAAGIPHTIVLTCALVFACSFVCATLSVHAVITHERHPPAVSIRSVAVAAIACAIGVLVWLTARGTLTAIAPWAATPICGSGGIVAIVPPRATRLRTVGWLLIASSLATAAILIVALR